MKLSQRLEGEFKAAVRQRGLNYHWQHQIRIRSGDARSVQADVTGSERYGMTLHWDDPFLTVWCDCPFFENEGPCKHLWGAILAAEAQGYLAEAANASELILDDGMLAYEDSGFEEDEDGQRPRPGVLPFAGPPAAKRQDVPAWKQEVNSLVMGRAVRERFYENWPAKREIVYQVDVQSSIAAANLVLALETRDRKADGSYTPPNRANIKRGHLRNLPAADREIMSLLAGGLEYHGWGDPDAYGHLPSSSLVTPALAAVILPLAVRTGRCFLKKPRQASTPVPLEWDEGEPWHFELEMNERKITGWTVKGFLRRGEERAELSDTALVTEGFVFLGHKVARLTAETQTEWVQHMQQQRRHHRVGQGRRGSHGRAFDAAGGAAAHRAAGTGFRRNFA